MTMMLLPEIAIGSLRPIREAVGQDADCFSEADLYDTASGLQIAIEGVKLLWSQQRSRLAEGMAAHKLAKSTKLFLDCLHGSLQLLARLEVLSKNFSSAEEGIRRIVSGTERRARELTAEISQIHDRVTRPVDAGFAERVEKAIAEEPGVYIPLDDILNRLNSGGDI